MNITKRTALLSILFLVLAMVLAVQVSAIPVMHTSPAGPLTIAEGDSLEVDVTFSGMVGALKEFEYFLYDSSGTLLQGGYRSFHSGGGVGPDSGASGGTAPALNEALPLSWTSSSSETGEPIEEFSFSPHFDSAASSPYMLRLRMVDEGETTDEADDLPAELAVALTVQESALEIHADPDNFVVIREGQTQDITITFHNAVGSLRVTYFHLPDFVSVQGDVESGLTFHITPDYAAADSFFGRYRFSVWAYDDMGTPDSPGDDTSAEILITLTIINVFPPPSDPTVTIDPEWPFVLTEGETFDAVVTFDDAVGTIHDSRYFIQSSGNVQPSFVTAGGDEQTGVTLHFIPDFNAAALSPYNLRIDAIDDMGTPSLADDKVTSTYIPFEVLDAAPSGGFDLVADPAGPITVVEGETVDVTFFFDEPIGNAYGYSITPSSASFNELDVSVARAMGESNITLRFAPDFGSAGTYEVRFNAMDGTGSIESVTLPFTVTESISPGMTIYPSSPLVAQGRGLDVDVIIHGLTGDVADIRVLGDATTFMTKADTMTGATLRFEPPLGSSGGVPYYSPGSLDVTGSQYGVEIIAIDDMGTASDTSDDVEIRGTFDLIVTDSLQIEVSQKDGSDWVEPDSSGAITLAEGDTLKILTEFNSPIGVRTDSVIVSTFASPSFIQEQDWGDSQRIKILDIAPGYAAAAMSPYELILVGVDNNGTEEDDRDNKIVSRVVPLIITESETPSSNFSITVDPSGPITLTEGKDSIEVTFTFNDMVGNLRGIGYHIAPSSPAFNTFDVEVVGKDANSVTLYLEPETGAASSRPYDLTIYGVDDMGTPFDLSDDRETSLIVPVTVTAAVGSSSASNITLRDAELNPDRLSCSEGQNGATVAVDLELENTASAGVDDARILIRNTDFGVDITERDITIDGEERESLRYSFSVPAGTAPGDYEIDLKAYLGSDVAATEDLTLSISACSDGSSGRTVSVSRDSGSSASSFTPATQSQAASNSNRARSSPTTPTSIPSTIPTEEGEERSEEQSIPVNIAPNDQPESRGFLDFITGRTVVSGPGLSIVRERSILVTLIVIAGVLWVVVIILAGVVMVRMR